MVRLYANLSSLISSFSSLIWSSFKFSYELVLRTENSTIFFSSHFVQCSYFECVFMFIQRLMVIKALSLRNVWTVKTLRKEWFAGDYQETKSKKVTLNCETSPLKATFYIFKLALQAFWRVKAIFLLSVPKKLISIHFVTSTIVLLAMNKRWQTKLERSFKCPVGVIMISRQFYIVLDCATHWNFSLPSDFLWRIAWNLQKMRKWTATADLERHAYQAKLWKWVNCLFRRP